MNNEGHSLTSMLSQQPLEVKVTGSRGFEVTGDGSEIPRPTTWDV